MVIYCYYNSDTSKKVMPQIILGELLQKGGGASTEYISCISVNVQKGEGLPPSTCGVSV